MRTARDQNRSKAPSRPAHSKKDSALCHCGSLCLCGEISREGVHHRDTENAQRHREIVRFSLAATLVLILFTLASAQKKSSCIECHIKLDDTRLSAPAKLF